MSGTHYLIGCALLVAACGQPDLAHGTWAATATSADADVSHDGSGSGATFMTDAGSGSNDARIDNPDAGPTAVGDAGSAAPDAPSPDAPIYVDGGVYDAPPDSCTAESCSSCASATPPDPVREMIDLNVDHLDLTPGSYAYLRVTAQMSDGNFVPVYDTHWSSSNPMIATVSNGSVYVTRFASPGMTVHISVTTDDVLSTSLLLTVKAPDEPPQSGSNSPL